jgi:hypothetical protein
VRFDDEDQARRLVAQWLARKGRPDTIAELTAEWFPEERAFFDDPAQLTAAECGRRAGKTRGVVRDHLRDILTIPGYRGLYLNSTRGEAERLAWIGNRADGFRPLLERNKLLRSDGGPLVIDNQDLSIHNTATDGWMFLRGADDEAELRKALGGAYNKVTWDEAQKIPPKLGLSMREVFFPALLDFGGRFRMTGTPVRNMSGLFWEVTRPELEKRTPGWHVYNWNLLHNPFFGRPKVIGGQCFVAWGAFDEVVSGPHSPGELDAAVKGARWLKGILALQALYGGPEVAPVESPIMQREGFGRWVREDAAFVYALHKVPKDRVLYAPHRARPDGFPDIAAALRDLPYDWRDAMFSLGCDIGWNPDPFAFVLWSWHRHDPALYEVASYRKTHLTSDQQVACLREVQQHVNIGLIVADASGPAKPTVKGWSADWVTRYNLPILEADKQHKYPHIDLMNTDIHRGRLKLREDGPLYLEMAELQWATIVTGTGRMIEDPTMPNDVCDGGLYGHRHSYQYRWMPEDKQPPRGSLESLLREERELEDAIMEDADG